MAVNTRATQDSEGKAAQKSENDNEDYTELEAIYENDNYEYLKDNPHSLYVS